MSDLELMTQGERILWRGKPNFKCFVLEAIFNPMLIFALVWGAFDFFVIGTMVLAGKFEQSGYIGMLIPFFLFHLMPVWIYLGGVITSVIRYKNTEYIVTERGIYVSGGVISKNNEMKPFTDLSHIAVHRGFFDSILGVGDVISTCGHDSYNGATSSPYLHYGRGRRTHNHNQGINICDIEDYQQVFTIIKQAQTDVYADTMYPNARRPENNPGYNTRYDRF